MRLDLHRPRKVGGVVISRNVKSSISLKSYHLGIGDNGNVFFTIDFGHAINLDATEGHGIQDDRPLGGTTRYASLNNHRGLGKLHPAGTTFIH